MDVDIFQMLMEDFDRRKARRAELLKTLGVKEYFSDGEISIDNKICQGIECKLCIKACPTSALYWSYGQVNVIEEICIYCAACVLNCIVDDCIKVTRKRPDGRIEKFSRPIDAIKLLNSISSKRRSNLVSRVFQH